MALTGKQRAMVEERIKDPRASNAEIIKRAGYNIRGTGNKATNVASQIYLENMRNHEIASLLDGVSEEIEKSVIDVVRRYRNSDDITEVKEAMLNARWIHDKVKGKAVQRSENTNLNMNVEITQESMRLSEAFTVFLKQKTVQ